MRVSLRARRRLISSRPIPAVLVPCLLGFSAASLGAASRSWDGDCDEFWEGGCPDPEDPSIDPRTLTNWDNDSYPTPLDSVVINAPAVTVVVNTSESVSSIIAHTPVRVRRDFSVAGAAVLNSGRLDLGGFTFDALSLTLNSSSTWLGGDISARTVTVNGDLTVTGNNSRLIDRTSLTNDGTVVFSGSRALEDSSTITNEGDWDMSGSNIEISDDGSAGTLFTNSSLAQKTGAGSARISAPFVNSGGDIEVQSGELSFSDDAAIEGGSLSADAGGVLSFLLSTSANVRLEDVTTTGMGSVRFAGLGVARVFGPITNELSSANGLHFDNASEIDLQAPIINNGKAVWSGTDVGGDAEFTNQPASELFITGSTSRLRTKLSNRGEVVQFSDLDLRDGVVETLEGSLYRLRNARVLAPFGFESRFEVTRGSVESSGSSEIRAFFHTSSDGGFDRPSVSAASGVLTFLGGGRLNDVQFTVSDGAQIRLAEGSYESGPDGFLGAYIEGAGAFRVETGASWANNLDSAGPNIVCMEDPGAFVLAGGVLGGRLESNRFVWEAGELDETCQFINRGEAVMTGNGILNGTAVNLGGVDLINGQGGFRDGRWVQQGGMLSIGSTGTFLNHNDGFGESIFELQDGAAVAGEGRFFNSSRGLTGKVDAAGDSRIDCQFHNAHGEVNAISGTLTLGGTVADLQDGRLLGGRWNVRPGAVMEFPESIEVIGGGARVTNHGSIPDLQVKEVEETSWLDTNRLEIQQDIRIHGFFRSGGRVDAESFTNEEDARLEAVIPVLRETTPDSLPSSSKADEKDDSPPKYEDGFVVPSGFTNRGTLHPGGLDTPGYLPVEGAFSQTPTGIIVCDLAGPANTAGSAAQYDATVVVGNAALDGLLTVRLVEGFAAAVASSDTFVILKCTNLSGAFANAPHGSRLHTADGTGSLLVSYSADSVMLSDFAPGPNPVEAASPALDVHHRSDVDLLELTGHGTPGHEYILEANESLEPDSWTAVTLFFPSANGRARTFEPLPGPRQFYRLRRR